MNDKDFFTLQTDHFLLEGRSRSGHETVFRIKDRNRIVYGAGSTVTQTGEIKTKGFELEASRTLPAGVWTTNG